MGKTGSMGRRAQPPSQVSVMGSGSGKQGARGGGKGERRIVRTSNWRKCKQPYAIVYRTGPLLLFFT